MYSSKFQATLLLVVVSFSFSAGLKCYNCQYIEGVTTNNDCKSNLRDDFLQDVPADARIPSIPSSNETSKLLQKFNTTKFKGADDAKQNVVPLCVKVAAKAGGIETITRAGTNAPSEFADMCEKESEYGVEVTTCFCDTDGCNSAKAIVLNVGLVIVGATFALFKLNNA